MNKDHTITKNWGLFFISILILILPYFLFENTSIAILASLSFIIIYFAGFLFWLHFIPHLSINTANQRLRFLLVLFRNALFKQGKIFSVKNGNFDRDYFALINKPAINGLLLDQHSAVVTRDRQGNKHVYFSGLHLLSPGEQVVHSLDLCQRYFHWGSDPTQNPFKTPKHDPSSYESIGRNFSAVSITGTGLINEIILAPAFSIHYTLISAEQEANWIRKVRVLSSLFESQKIYGNLSPQIDELIGTHITGQIKNIIQNIKFPSAPIKDAFPANILQSIETLLDKHLSDEQLEKSLETQILRQMTVKVHVEKVWVK